jgi:hypothetical protein
LNLKIANVCREVVKLGRIILDYPLLRTNPRRAAVRHGRGRVEDRLSDCQH